MTVPPRRIAIVGAGMAGAACARGLADAGFDVTVFEKSRGAGGRMSTRRVPPHAFDHGAQYATARSGAFRAAMAAWVEAGVAARWDGRLVDLRAGAATDHPRRHPRYVGVPGMNAIAKHLLRDIPLARATRIVRIERRADGWQLRDEHDGDHGTFDATVVTAPPEQTRLLLHDAPVLAADAARAELAPCWAWMATFDEPTGIPFDGAFVSDSPLSWIARGSAKPGRDAPAETWIAHASPAWSEAHVDEDPEHVRATLADAFRRDTGHGLATPTLTLVHRWLYAFPVRDLARPFLWDAQASIGVAGDWVLGARVESAWTSGDALAREIAAAAALR